MFLEVLKERKKNHVPIWFMRQAGRTLPEYRALREKTKSFWDLCLTPEHIVEITLQPIRRFHLDVAILFSDILMVPKALGQKGKLIENIGPVLDSAFIHNPIQKRPDEISTFFLPIQEAIREIVRQKPKNCTLMGFAGGPWTVACYMVEGQKTRHHEKIKAYAYEDPTRMEALLEYITDATFNFLVAQVEAGVEALQIFETWGGVLPEPYYQRWVLGPTITLCRRLKAHFPSLPLIYFPRQGAPYYEIICQGLKDLISGINLDHVVSAAQFSTLKNEPIAFQGGVDPVFLMTGGPEMKKEIVRILNIFSDSPYIFNLSHGLLPETPIAHIQAAIDCVRDISLKRAA